LSAWTDYTHRNSLQKKNKVKPNFDILNKQQNIVCMDGYGSAQNLNLAKLTNIHPQLLSDPVDRQTDTQSNKPRQKCSLSLDHSVFYRPDALPAVQPTASKH